MAQQSEAFGPFSEQISIRNFLDLAEKYTEDGHDAWNIENYPAEEWSSTLPKAAQSVVERECQWVNSLDSETHLNAYIKSRWHPRRDYKTTGEHYHTLSHHLWETWYAAHPLFGIRPWQEAKTKPRCQFW